MVRLPPSGVAGGLEVTDFLPVLEDLPAGFFTPVVAAAAVRASTEVVPFAAALAVDFLAEAFFPPLALGAVAVSFLGCLPLPARTSTLVLPSLNYHSPQELARTPWETTFFPPVIGAISIFLPAAAAHTCW